jgi:hypothetical protein
MKKFKQSMADIMSTPFASKEISMDLSNDVTPVQRPDHTESIANLTAIQESFDAPSSNLNAILAVLESNEQIYDNETK